MGKRVAVMMGGWSAEREVSLSSGQECAKALKEAGYTVTTIDVGRDLPALLAALDPRPDVLFNALHGKGGEDGTVQGVFELLGIPYTHSGILASAVAMNKELAKAVFRQAGIPVPDGRVVPAEDVAAGHVLAPPYIVKPVDEGSSVGITIVHPGDNQPGIDRNSWAYGRSVLVESYIPGRELTVAVMGDRSLAVTEIKPRQRFYDYAAKYTKGQADHHIPADLPPAVYENCLRLALKAHQVLGCSGVSRADFRYDDSKPGSQGLFMLEVNTQPGMTPLSLVPEQAAYAGMSFSALCSWMVENAQCHA
ncbi:MAG: D-alanine--D-alanine ligase [Inquilinaceae bacterium]